VYKSHFYIVVFVLLLLSCRSYVPIGQQNLAPLYDMPTVELNQQITLYRTPERKMLISQIKTDDLLFTREKSTDEFSCRYLIRWSIYENTTQKMPIDSGRVVYQKTTDAPIINDSISINWPNKGSFWVDVRFFDLNRRSVNRTLRQYQAENAGFILVLDSSNKPVTELFLQTNRTYTIQTEEQQTINFSFFQALDSLPPPPFIVFDAKPLQFKPIELPNFQFSDNQFTLPDTIPYIVEIEINKRKVHFYVGSSTFPQLNDASDLLFPMRFLMSDDEFKKLQTATDLKMAVDQFWLESGGSKDRARELIKAYYKKVVRANQMFTNTSEGWKTDQGIIYLIFGEPDRLFDSDQSQLWVYLENGRMAPVNFEFKKIATPFGPSLQLQRDRFYKPIWYMAVDAWRNGFISTRY
jgi:GWxTD domain-containing protein